MATDSSDREPAEAPAAAVPRSSAGGALLLLACPFYALLLGMLPEAGDFPNEGGGEDRIAWGFQQFWAYVAGCVTLGLLWLALWRACRSGGIAVRTTLGLVPAAGAAMIFAMAQSFEQPGPWLPLVPMLLPPVIAVYALWGCLPALSGRLPRWVRLGVPRATIDRTAIGLIAVLALAVIPFALLDSASWPGRLERHHAEQTAADAAARAAGEQEEQARRAKLARLGPDSSLRDYIEAEQWYLSGVDILAGARQVKSRQSDALAMLKQGGILDLSDLWRLDLRPEPALCEAYGSALAATFGRSEIYRGSAYLRLFDRQFPNLRWLREGHCDLDGPIAEVDAQLSWMLESKDPSGAAENDSAAYYSRFGVNREAVEDMRTKLAALRGAR